MITRRTTRTLLLVLTGLQAVGCNQGSLAPIARTTTPAASQAPAQPNDAGRGKRLAPPDFAAEGAGRLGLEPGEHDDGHGHFVIQARVAWPTGKTKEHGKGKKPKPAPSASASASPGPSPAPGTQVEAKILIVAADGNEPELPAIKQTLEYQGTPYEVHVATQAPGGLTAEKLASNGKGNYYGVILTTGEVGYFDGTTWASALSAAEWEALRAYEAAYKVRQVTWYTFPTAEYGFQAATPISTDTQPLPASLTATGQQLFSYLTPGASIPIKFAYTYLAQPLDASTTPLLTDAAGNALAAIKTYADGRENLAMTFDSNPHMLHHIVLSYGVISWLTRGVFLGERKVYLSAQNDDLFFENDLYLGGTYRMTGGDLTAVKKWQDAKQGQALYQQLKIDYAFNGNGTVPGSWDYKDTLTPTAKKLRGEFKWISHTYTHMNLDAATYDQTTVELLDNHQVANKLDFPAYLAGNLVTGQISGLSNPEAMRAAWDAGVRQLVSDTSRAGMGNPSPNAGIWNWMQAGILMIPRYPTNLFYNVSTPDEWTAEYNSFHAAYWGRNLGYEEVLDKETDVLLFYLLKGDANPWMFHQSNTRAYDGSRTLLTDLLDRLLAKYQAYYNLPLQSPTMDKLADKFRQRMAFNAAGVSATISNGTTITLRATKEALVPVTGLGTGGSTETYGGQKITQVKLSAGQTATFNL